MVLITMMIINFIIIVPATTTGNDHRERAVRELIVFARWTFLKQQLCPYRLCNLS